MTLTQLRNKANTVLTSFWTELASREEVYFAKHGRYFQLLASPDTIVDDGADSTFQTKLAAYEDKIADIQLAFASAIPFQIQVHQLTGGEVGYMGIVQITHNGKTYRRDRYSDGKDTGWIDITDDKLWI